MQAVVAVGGLQAGSPFHTALAVASRIGLTSVTRTARHDDSASEESLPSTTGRSHYQAHLVIVVIKTSKRSQRGSRLGTFEHFCGAARSCWPFAAFAALLAAPAGAGTAKIASDRYIVLFAGDQKATSFKFQQTTRQPSRP